MTYMYHSWHMVDTKKEGSSHALKGHFPVRYIFFSFLVFGHATWHVESAWGILVLGPGIKPVPPAVEAWSLNHWTAREVPH